MKIAHPDRGPLQPGGGLAMSHSICPGRSDRANARERRYGRVDFRSPDAGFHLPGWSSYLSSVGSSFDVWGSKFSVHEARASTFPSPKRLGPLQTSSGALVVEFSAPAQAHSQPTAAGSQPYIVVNRLDSMVRAVLTTFRGIFNGPPAAPHKDTLAPMAGANGGCVSKISAWRLACR